MPKYVYDFSEGNRDLKDLLGGKGANLAEMTNLGLPVPPGFTITTEACKVYLESGERARRPRAPRSASTSTRSRRRWASARPARRPAARQRALRREVLDARDDGHRPQHRPQRRVGRRPGEAGRQRAVRLGLLPPADPDVRQDRPRRRRRALRRGLRRGQDGQGHHERPRPRRRRPARASSRKYKEIVAKHAGRPFPQDPREQLDLAVRAVFDSWNGDRAKLYRRQERIPADLGTAVNVVAMVFGNIGMDSGTGVAFTRDPGSGEQGVYGDYLQNAQGEDVVAGIRNTVGARRPRGHRQAGVRRADARSCPRWRTTTATCATSSSPSSATSSGCCRPGSASAPPPPRSSSRSSSSTRA